MILFVQGAHLKANPAVLKDSLDKTLQFIEQGKLKGPHVSAAFDLDQVSSQAPPRPLPSQKPPCWSAVRALNFQG